LERKWDPECTSTQNINICCVFIDTVTLKAFRRFDVQKIHNALSKSKLFAGFDVSTWKIRTLTAQIMNYFPFGQMEYTYTVGCLGHTLHSC